MGSKPFLKISGALAIAASLLLTGCTVNINKTADNAPNSEVAGKSTNEALEKYADLERDSVKESMEQFADVYSDIRVLTSDPNTITFSYTYLEPVDIDQTSSNLDAVIPTLEESVINDIFPAMESYGVEGTKTVVYEYNDSDGTNFWRWEYTN